MMITGIRSALASKPLTAPSAAPSAMQMTPPSHGSTPSRTAIAPTIVVRTYIPPTERSSSPIARRKTIASAMNP
jgi:hypothetical protein